MPSSYTSTPPRGKDTFPLSLSLSPPHVYVNPSSFSFAPSPILLAYIILCSTSIIYSSVMILFVFY